jgi:hypothetical protein
MRVIRFRRVDCEASIFLADGFIDETETLAVLGAAEALAPARGEDSPFGLHFELPVEAEPTLQAITRRIEAVLGFSNGLGDTFRYRRYGAGQGHPPHSDCYEVREWSLVATAMLWLTEPEGGGETRFQAGRRPVRLLPRRGRLAVWLNYRDGEPDAAAVHEGLEVLGGSKTTLTSFIYAGADDIPAFAAGLTPERELDGVVYEA